MVRDQYGDREAYGKAFHLSHETNNEAMFTRDSYIDAMLINFTDDELFGRGLDFNPLDYALSQSAKFQKDPSKTVTQPRHISLVIDDVSYEDTVHTHTGNDYAIESNNHLLQTNPSKIDYHAMRPYLGFQTVDRIKKTIAKTTQWAKTMTHFPMRKHKKARFPHLNVRRLDEKVSTDPLFSSHRDVSGATCGQVFFGMTTKMFNIYGMRNKGEFSNAYLDFIRSEGAPRVLRRDNAKEENSEEVKNINRKYVVADEFSEPYHQNQNPVELNAIKWLKHHAQILMDRVNCPPDVWLQACQYLADIHNISANDGLNDEIPLQKRHGSTPDISAYLQFVFWQKVFYMQHTSSFPATTEKAGYFIGVSHNVGDNLCFKILTADTGEIIHTSMVRAADKRYPNRRVRFGEPIDDAQLDIQLPSAQTEPANTPSPSEPVDTPDDDDARPATDNEDEIRVAFSEFPFPKLLPGTQYAQRRKKPASKATPSMFKNKNLRRSRRRATNPHQATAPYPGTNAMFKGQRVPFGTRITKPFHDKMYSGTITQFDPLTEYYHVQYDDGDSEEFDLHDCQQYFTDPTDLITPIPPIANPDPILDPHSGEIFGGDSGERNHSDSGEHNHDNVPDNNEDVGENLESTPMIAKAYVAHDFWDNRYDHDFDETQRLGPNCRIGLTLTSSEIETLNQQQHLDYVQDIYDPDVDTDSDAFKILAVTDHMIRHRDTDQETIKLQVLFVTGEKHWYEMDIIRLESPMLIVEYALQKRLVAKRHFSWVTSFCNENDMEALVLKAKLAGREPKIKFGVQVPNNQKQAILLDKANGDDLWITAIDKELKQIDEYDTFKVLEDGETMPEGYQLIPYHLVFDCKFDFRRKARLVAGGNFTEAPPQEDIYSGVVGMETIRYCMQVAAMNKLQVCAADVGNAFLYGKTREKVYVIAGPEFGEHAGKRMIIDKGLYGLRTSGARFHEHLAAKLRTLGFEPSKADDDLWIRAQDDHYEFIATYVDDLLVFSRDPSPIIEEIRDDYILKGVGEPEYYLGADMEALNQEWQKDSATSAIASNTYIKRVTERFELLEGGNPLPNASVPMSSEYHPELETSSFVSPIMATKYRGMIGSANWLVTLGRLDIAFATNSLSRYSMAPREGHYKAMRAVLGYLKTNPNGKIVFDPTKLRRLATATSSDEEYFKPWENKYPGLSEDLPPDLLPETKGASTTLSCYVDADHARDQVTRRSVTGMIIFMGSTPIVWMSKRQNTVETSTYGAEMVAARIATERVIEVRWNLRAMGVLIEGPTMMYGDNKSVILSTTMPSSVLKKKHLSCNYFRIREAIAARILRFEFVPTHMNYADVLTKPLAKSVFNKLIKPILFRVPPNQRSETQQIIPDHILPTTNTKTLSENTQPPMTSEMTLSPFPIVPAAAA
jgi:hypothetical protein